MTFLWHFINLLHNDKWCKYFYHIWIFSLKHNHQLTKTKLKFQEKSSKFWFYLHVVFTVHKLFKHDFCHSWLKFFSKFWIFISKWKLYVTLNVSISLKYGEKFLTSLTKLVLKVKASIYCYIVVSFWYLLLS